MGIEGEAPGEGRYTPDRRLSAQGAEGVHGVQGVQPMPYADHDGVRIHYHVEGSGPPLVLHHGYSGSLRHWRMNGYVDALRDEYQLIAVDARGHGESDKPHNVADYALATRSADVLQILDDLGIERALYCGFSMGGNVAYGLLTMHPERIAVASHGPTNDGRSRRVVRTRCDSCPRRESANILTERGDQCPDRSRRTTFVC